MRERGGLHFNVRKTCLTVYEGNGKPVGVEVATSYDPDAEEPTLKYAKPVFSSDTVKEAIERLNDHEIEVLFDNLDYGDKLFDAISERMTANMQQTHGADHVEALFSQAIGQTLEEFDIGEV